MNSKPLPLWLVGVALVALVGVVILVGVILTRPGVVDPGPFTEPIPSESG